ncbi:hypothetical protein [Mesorhizobium sp. B2-7-2]|uniref:hypothetical protein n=1 Tax=Mesorhizobium sp. B2-7-2 TaxID=2589908 RepID=UPI001129C1AA|nr:hypothetical protein [Mesorhizobium sp. B2-7-2]TPJ29711.1 hypothetical protein FJ425_07645 [Mesorhizobium sp. B2-7-2]
MTVTFFRLINVCLTTFGAVVVRTTVVRCFAVGAGSTLGLTVVQPVVAKTPDSIVAMIACFNALPTTFSPF